MDPSNPYAAPKFKVGALADEFAGSTSVVRRFLKDPNGLTTVLKVLLFISIFVDMLSLVSSLMSYQLLTSGEITQEAGDMDDMREGLVGLLSFLMTLMTGFVFFKWFYRSNLNVHGFGVQGMRFKPGWTIGWYFVPFLNLVRPYQAMREVWQGSEAPEDPA